MEKVYIFDTDRNSEEIDSNLIQIVKKILDDTKTEVKNRTVLVKPNMLGAFDPARGATTDPVLIKAIVEVLEERGAGNILVGDSPGGAENGIIGTAKKCGLYDASKGHFLNFSKDATMVNLESRFTKQISVPKSLLEADLVINVPKLKTHGFMGFSACIKNMFGIVIGPYKAKLHFRAPSIEQFGELLVDIYKVREPDLNIIDAMIVMEGDGPTSGPTRQENMVIAGKNGVIVDQIVAEMLGFNCEEVKYLTAAKKRHLGEWDREKIQVDGPFRQIENLVRPVTYKAIESKDDEESGDVKLASSGLKVFAEIGRMAPKLVRKDDCIKCSICAINCPAKAIAMTPYPEINYKKCISCYCCSELCHENCYDIWDTGNKMENMFQEFRSQ